MIGSLVSCCGNVFQRKGTNYMSKRSQCWTLGDRSMSSTCRLSAGELECSRTAVWEMLVLCKLQLILHKQPSSENPNPRMGERATRMRFGACFMLMAYIHVHVLQNIEL